jgi:hypothetical protein
MFSDCTALTTVNVPNATIVENYAFDGCTALASIDLPKVTSLGTEAFDRCKALKTVILRSETVCSTTLSAFNNTPFASSGTGGTVYVPQALIESYQNATNWSALYAAGKCNFVAIEGSEYE